MLDRMEPMRVPNRLEFSRPLIFLSWYSLILLCFVLTPLWNSFPGPICKGLGLTTITSLGFVWAWWGSGKLRTLPVHQGVWYLLFLLGFCALDYHALTASIPWRGDEDYHIFFAQYLALVMASHPAYLVILVIFLGWAMTQKDMNGKVVAAAIALTFLAAWAGKNAHVDIYHALRYPIFIKYLVALPAYLSTFLPASPYPEIPYRLVPLLSAAGLAWAGFLFLGKHPILIRLGGALALATLPIVRYYDSLFYLELPAVLCMTIVCFQATALLRSEPNQMTSLPSWHALLLLGFIKETALPFLVVFLFCRAASRLPALISRGSFPWKDLFAEARMAFCIFFPLFLYLGLRIRLGNTRSYAPDIAYLGDIGLWLTQSRSWWDSFGLLMPLSLGGALLLMLRGKWNLLAFLGLTFFIDATFHFLDDRQYTGYSRFNLFLLPSLISLAWETLRFGAVRMIPATVGVLTLVTAANLILSPVQWDGSKKAGWGIYGSDIGDQYYPYREALDWLAKKHKGQKARLSGLYYPYFTSFYLKEKGWPEQNLVAKPLDEASLMDSVLEASNREGFEAVLFHVMGEPKVPTDLHGYKNAKIFRNCAHALILFSHSESS